MEQRINILYIHGMGGGADSRIPNILKDYFNCQGGICCDSQYEISVVCRTYSFDPVVAWKQICGWVEELSPVLVIGESLGACNALKIKGIPHIFVSPSLNAPLYLGCFAWTALIPGMTTLFDRIYKPREGDRQSLHFVWRILKNYRGHRRAALEASRGEDCFAFFGTRDHYRRSGIVSIRSWRRHFGKDSYQMYEGTHFMEEEYIYSLLVPKIIQTLEKLRGE